MSAEGEGRESRDQSLEFMARRCGWRCQWGGLHDVGLDDVGLGYRMGYGIWDGVWGADIRQDIRHDTATRCWTQDTGHQDTGHGHEMLDTGHRTSR